MGSSKAPKPVDRDAVLIRYAGEPLREANGFMAPDVNAFVVKGSFRVIAIEALVVMKLATHRRVDRMNLRDLIDVGLVDESWTEGLPALLSERLQCLLDDPEG